MNSKTLVILDMVQILHPAGGEIIKNYHFVAIVKQALYKVASDKASAAGDYDLTLVTHLLLLPPYASYQCLIDYKG